MAVWAGRKFMETQRCGESHEGLCCTESVQTMPYIHGHAHVIWGALVRYTHMRVEFKLPSQHFAHVPVLL